MIAAYGRHLATSGGRGGRPAAPATARVYLVDAARACARPRPRRRGRRRADPRHAPGPPETLTATDYANLLRVPDRRTVAGKRDHALLRVLGDCGLRSAEPVHGDSREGKGLVVGVSAKALEQRVLVEQRDAASERVDRHPRLECL